MSFCTFWPSWTHCGEYKGPRQLGDWSCSAVLLLRWRMDYMCNTSRNTSLYTRLTQDAVNFMFWVNRSTRKMFIVLFQSSKLGPFLMWTQTGITSYEPRFLPLFKFAVFFMWTISCFMMQSCWNSLITAGSWWSQPCTLNRTLEWWCKEHSLLWFCYILHATCIQCNPWINEVFSMAVCNLGQTFRLSLHDSKHPACHSSL